MRAEFIGRTLVVTPESDEDREQLKYYGANSDRLWECYGIEESDGSLSVQALCPVGLQDNELVDYIRQLLECDREPLDTDSPNLAVQLSDRIVKDRKTMDQIRQVLECE